MDEQLHHLLRVAFKAGYGHALGMVPSPETVDAAWKQFDRDVLTDIGLEQIMLVKTED